MQTFMRRFRAMEKAVSGHSRGEEVRLRWKYRDLILRRRLRLPEPAARQLVGPDCAYHLYRRIGGQGIEPELLSALAVLPRLTADLPGTGGTVKHIPEDFVVEEVLGWKPSGSGEHLYLWVEKRNLSAEALFAHLAAVLGIARQTIGAAGLKDTRAITRQWISVPATSEKRLGTVVRDDIRVLAVTRDSHKLRAGQLAGNRFDCLIRDPLPDAKARAEAIKDRLLADGLPNFYGPQRFGRGGISARVGFELLACGVFLRSGPGKRFALSAAQSLLFNSWLAHRLAAGGMRCAVPGEILQVRKTGLPCWVTDVGLAERRLAAREVVPMGPMFGPRMKPARDAAACIEEALLKKAGLTPQNFATFGKLCYGSRRPAFIWPTEIDLQAEAAGLRVHFFLPAGVYGTVLLGELHK